MSSFKLLRLPRSRSRRALLVLSLFVICLLGVFGYILNAPARGTIILHPTTSPKLHTSVLQSQPIQQSNDYFTLNLPAGFSALKTATPPSGILALSSIRKNGTAGTQLISISIKQIPDGGFTNDSSYAVRQSQPQNYTFSTHVIDGETVTIATSTKSAGIVAFWPHKNVMATISLSETFDDPMSSSNTALHTTLHTVLDSWQWQ